MKKETGGPAFARPYSHDNFNDETELAQHGMTLRDYFAAHAMQGKIAAGATGYEDVAFYAYKYADAMLKAREQ